MTTAGPRLREALNGVSGIHGRAAALIRAMAPFEELRAEERNGANVTVVKSALRLMDEDCGPTRPPSAWPLAPEAGATLARLLAEWGLVRATPVV